MRFMGLREMRRPFAALLPYILKYKGLYMLLGLLMFAEIGITLFLTWFLGRIAEAALDGNRGQIGWLIACGCAAIAVAFVSRFYEAYLEAEAVNRVKRDLKLSLFAHLMRLPTRFFGANHSGDLVSRLMNDAAAAEGASGSNLLSLVRLPLLAGAAFLYLLFIRWQLALVVLLLGPAAMLTAGLCGKLMRDTGRKLQELLGRMNAMLQDIFAGMTVLRAFALERKMSGAYERLCDDALRLERREARLYGWLQAGSGTLSLGAFVLSLGLGAYAVVRGDMTIGSLFAFVSLVQYLVYPFSGVARQWGGLQRSLAAVERIRSVLDETPDRPPNPAYRPPRPLHLGIRLERLTFSYEDGKPALGGIDLWIPAGSTVAFVGPSGAGKSTLFQLLAGLHRPTGGDILFDGYRLSDTDPELWRSYISYVPQEPYLFAGTIRDNIAGGRPDATEADIVAAARNANAHDFIAALPGGYDTPIGERGGKLSGGQKQRITIARALLKDAPILLLDEATASLDTETERAVKDALRRLMAGRTVLIIAHRLATVRKADQILVLNGGKVVEQNTHERLLQSGGLYARLYERR